MCHSKPCSRAPRPHCQRPAHPDESWGEEVAESRLGGLSGGENQAGRAWGP